MSAYFTKESYIGLCREQSEAIGRMIQGLGIIKDIIPENGKRFDARRTNAINERLSEIGILCCISKETYDNSISYLNVRQVKYSGRAYNRIKVGRSEDIFKGGIMGDRESLINSLDEWVEKLKQVKEEYDAAPSKVGDFIGMYRKLYDLWKEVRRFKMPDIFIDGISSEPPIY